MEHAYPNHLMGENWQRQCVIRSEDMHLPADNTVPYKLLHKLMSSGDNKQEVITEAALSLGCLRMAYPTVSIADDDDVVYLLSKGTSTRSVEMGVAVDVRTGTLQGVAKLDTKGILFLAAAALPVGSRLQIYQNYRYPDGSSSILFSRAYLINHELFNLM